VCEVIAVSVLKHTANVNLSTAAIALIKKAANHSTQTYCTARTIISIDKDVAHEYHFNGGAS